MQRLTIRLVSNLSKLLKKIAEEKGLSVNALITQMCWQFVEEWEKNKKN